MLTSSATPPIAKRRACVVCTAAKAKCTPQTANLCQRCARLGKSCTYLDMPQTKRRHMNGPKRVEELEAKVSQLTSELARYTQTNNQTSPSVSKSAQSPLIAHATEPDPPGDADLLGVAEYSSHGVDPPTTSALAHQPSIVDQGLITGEEAKDLVDEFCANFVPKFPFSALSRTETAAHLKDKAPFLLLCIVGAAMRTRHPVRKTIMEEIMKHISIRIVTHSERSLMLLRGLLIHCAWYSYPALKNHPQLLLLVQLCVSMVYDLGLHKKSELKDDEKRALLGTYWLSVGMFSGLGRPAVMKHNSRIEQMSNSPEQSSDRRLASFVHLQSLLARIDESYDAMQGSQGGTMLVIATHNSLQRQLQSIKVSIEQVLASWPAPTVNAMLSEIKFMEMRLEEPSLQNDLWLQTHPTSSIRTTMLVNLIQRSKDLIQGVNSLPDEEVTSITIATLSHLCSAVGTMATAVLTLIKLVADQASDPPSLTSRAEAQSIVDSADYPNLVLRLVQVLETRVHGVSDADREMDIVGSLCHGMRLLVRYFPYRVRAIIDPDVSSAPSGSDSVPNTAAESRDLGEVATSPPVVPFTNDGFDSTIFFDDVQWAAIMGEFSGAALPAIN